MSWKISARIAKHTMTPSDLLSAADLERYCREHQLAAQVVRLEVPTPTVQAAAQAVGCPVDQIVKSVLFLVNGSPVVAITNGLQPIDRRVIAEYYQVGKKRVRLAQSEEVARHTGYAAGALPPFGHRAALTTFLDQQVLVQMQVYAGGGSENALLRLAPGVIQQAVPVILLPLTSS
jgi:prolyl-tRNA editing enzyme YbaK/EbsC (Cys-tRNA(Pro) deacylase)